METPDDLDSLLDDDIVGHRTDDPVLADIEDLLGGSPPAEEPRLPDGVFPYAVWEAAENEIPVLLEMGFGSWRTDQLIDAARTCCLFPTVTQTVPGSWPRIYGETEGWLWERLDQTRALVRAAALLLLAADRLNGSS